MTAIVFYYDVVCPYAYLASTRIEAIAARAGADLEWRPILLGGLFREIGAPDAPATPPPAKVRLGRLDLARYAALYDVPLRLPAEHPRRTVQAMRLVTAVEGADRVRLTHALYRAYFADGRDVADPHVLAELVASVGLDSALIARSEEPAVKESLRSATAAAAADGAFGVPSFVVVRSGARTLYFGQDRLQLVERAVAA
jgi:2-hydroxychromene-2-carboxylate isomerase